MTKKFENFGTALSREQMKKIMGGCDITELCDDGGGGAGSTCSTHCYAWNPQTMSMDYLTCGYVAGVGGLPGSCICPKGSGSCS